MLASLRSSLASPRVARAKRAMRRESEAPLWQKPDVPVHYTRTTWSWRPAHTDCNMRLSHRYRAATRISLILVASGGVRGVLQPAGLGGRRFRVRSIRDTFTPEGHFARSLESPPCRS
jgi:hypothetical protein